MNKNINIEANLINIEIEENFMKIGKEYLSRRKSSIPRKMASHWR